MSPLNVVSKVCIAPFYVRSKVCIAPFHVRSKVYEFAPHMDGAMQTLLRTWKKAMQTQTCTNIGIGIDRKAVGALLCADFAPRIEWRHSYRIQIIAKFVIFAYFQKEISKPPIF